MSLQGSGEILIKWPQHFSNQKSTMADIESHLYNRKKRKKNTTSGATPKGRHVKWIPSTLGYIQIRQGRPLESVHKIDDLFKNDAVEESHFYIFKRDDAFLDRNEDIPLYEAVYKCGSTFYRVQKKHLSCAYRKMGRCNKASMWNILEDGTPYWVDRYCISMMGQRDSKKRYEAKVKGRKRGRDE